MMSPLQTATRLLAKVEELISLNDPDYDPSHEFNTGSELHRAIKRFLADVEPKP